MRRATGAEYIVVGDTTGIHLSHPDQEKIGKPFVGGDLDAALRKGKAYASQATGTLGPSLRGIVPIRDNQQTIIGFVAVGYLTSDIETMIHDKQIEIIKYALIALLFGVFVATVIARGLTSAIMGLEVHEIAALFHERNAIIGAIREGIIAVDNRRNLTVVNQAARQYLVVPADRELHGLPLTEVFSCPELTRALTTGEMALDCEILLNKRTMIVSIMPIDQVGAGLVASFRPKDELDRLAQGLSQVQKYSELLRAQTHGYSNKLHTIAGLLQLDAHQEALNLVMTEANGYQELIRILAESVPDPLIAGVILGKYNRACELKIDLKFDPQNSFAALPLQLDREPLVTILGNILDNPFDAVCGRDHDNRLVKLHLTDLSSDLIIEIEDSGPGIAHDVVENLFATGVTTKEGNGRGTGLALVERAVTKLGGHITFGEGELGGALFTVIIPKS